MDIMCLFKACHWTADLVVLFDQIANSRGKWHQTVFTVKIRNPPTGPKFKYFHSEYSTECDYTAWL